MTFRTFGGILDLSHGKGSWTRRTVCGAGNASRQAAGRPFRRDMRSRPGPIREGNTEMAKLRSLRILLGIYLLTAAAGTAVYLLLPEAWPWWLNLLLADTAATVVTFFFSCIFRNASVYDPYWSVQPLYILTAFALVKGSGTAGIWALLLITVWSLRLTANWVYTFRSLDSYEDWRYKLLREKTGVFYPVVNFLGIHMVPTAVVWAATLPAALLVRTQAALTLPAALVMALCLFSVWLELRADLTMHRFRRERREGFCREGLWKYARHPNYLGEITFWWWLGLGALLIFRDRWYLLAGALANTVLFLAASIPMADRHQARKEGYAAYRRATRSLLPFRK